MTGGLRHRCAHQSFTMSSCGGERRWVIESSSSLLGKLWMTKHTKIIDDVEYKHCNFANSVPVVLLSSRCTGILRKSSMQIRHHRASSVADELGDLASSHFALA